MDSTMVYVPVEVAIQQGQVECIDQSIPLVAQIGIESFLEAYMFQESCIKKIEFEVEVFYRNHEGKKLPITATCQTICPAFVAAWVEPEAIKQFKKDQEKEST